MRKRRAPPRPRYAWLRTYGGCRRVRVLKGGRLREFPYTLAKAERCRDRGRHPHTRREVVLPLRFQRLP